MQPVKTTCSLMSKQSLSYLSRTAFQCRRSILPALNSWRCLAKTTLSHNLHTNGFTRIPLDMLVEEETTVGYRSERFYPVQIGDIFRSRYKVVAKLGFGTASTIWLCRDLKEKCFWTLKICVAEEDPCVTSNELLVSQHVKSIESDHPGRQLIRLAVDDFEVKGPHGMHQCLVMNPMGLTFTDFRNRLPDRAFTKKLLQQSLHLILIGLDFLHQAHIVHTDLSPNNILLGIMDSSVLPEIEQAEINHPSSRKILPDRTIYVSQRMPVTSGILAICDFGAARIGQTHTGDVMPAVYRAPEIIMNMEWNCKIDMWAFGVIIWDLFEGGRLFRVVKDNMINDEEHLAEMVSLMGPPPKEFLQRSENWRQYWDSDGNWIAKTPIPEQSLETREGRLEGADKELLLNLVRKLLRWLPEERLQAQDLFEDAFIVQHLLEDTPRIG